MGAKVRVHRCLRKFWYSEGAQDLVEYTLILAALAAAFFGLLGMFTPSINMIWTITNNNLSTAASTAIAGAS